MEELNKEIQSLKEELKRAYIRMECFKDLIKNKNRQLSESISKDKVKEIIDKLREENRIDELDTDLFINVEILIKELGLK